MPEFTDQLNRKIYLESTPQKIISLVPSQSELLFDLGLESEVIGITKFCVHPAEWFRTKTRIGGTKNPDLRKIIELSPSLVIANKEENLKEKVEEIAAHVPVWVSDVNNLEDAVEMIKSIGLITGRDEVAAEIISQIESGFKELQLKPVNACYLIWQEPYMTVGGDTFISDMMKQAGLVNVFEKHQRYPEISIEAIRDSGAELLLLSSEPYPFKQSHADQLKNLLSGMKVMLVDGEMFSWYGSRLIKAPAYFKQLRDYL